MEVKYQHLSELKPFENNPRVNDDAAVKLQKSIEEFGFIVPILIDKDNVIVAGHTRYKAAKALGIDIVPCVQVENLSDEQVRAFRIADNKYAELSSWDRTKLGMELNALSTEGFELDSLGFNTDELRAFTNSINCNDGANGTDFLCSTTLDHNNVPKSTPSSSKDVSEEEDNSDPLFESIIVDGILIPMDEYECNELTKRLEAYLDEYGTTQGFFRKLFREED